MSAAQSGAARRLLNESQALQDRLLDLWERVEPADEDRWRRLYRLVCKAELRTGRRFDRVQRAHAVELRSIRLELRRVMRGFPGVELDKLDGELS